MVFGPLANSRFARRKSSARATVHLRHHRHGHHHPRLGALVVALPLRHSAARRARDGVGDATAHAHQRQREPRRRRQHLHGPDGSAAGHQAVPRRMTRSELMALMTGGMATIAGGVLAAYVVACQAFQRRAPAHRLGHERARRAADREGDVAGERSRAKPPPARPPKFRAKPSTASTRSVAARAMA